MKRSAALGAALIAACAAALVPALVSPAMAGGWHRGGYASPRSYRSTPRNYGGGLRYYNSPRAYRSACGYGDCVCLRAMAIRTGNPVWWDKYQACTG
ncbi:MAG: hypothetical protein WC684_01345 [Hyphomicrobium sp.]|jgi:hypothetical protein